MHKTLAHAFTASTRFGSAPVCDKHGFMQVYGPRQPSTGAYAIVTGVFSQQQIDGEQLTIEGEPCCRYCFLVHASAAVDMPAATLMPSCTASHL